MNKRDLAVAVQENAFPEVGLPGCSRVVDAVIEGITNSLQQGEKVTLQGFGTFEVKSSQARAGRNPQNGEPIQIPAKKRVSFKCSPALKKELNG